MNIFGNYDYKKPYGNHEDFRTSTYRGHILMDDAPPIRPTGSVADVCYKFKADGGERQPCQSEVKESYTLKAPNPFSLRNPTLHDTQCIKTLNETRLLMPPRELPPHCSTYKGDYQSRELKAPDKLEENFTQAPVINDVKLSVNRIKPGYAKYLDPGATTHNLAFLAYTPQELGIARKDNITFYTWKKHNFNVFKTKETQCDKFISAQCPKRRREFRNTLKPVPHSGSLSEFKANYITHPDALNYDIAHVKNIQRNYARQPVKAESENTIYGSGKRTQKFV